MTKSTIAATLAMCLLAVQPCAQAADAPAKVNANLAILKQWVIGGDTRWDYLTLDSAASRLYIARASHVSVLNADTGAVLGDIPNTNGVHGTAIASEAGHGFTSNGKDNSVTMFDLKSLKALETIKVGEKPDAIIYDPGSERVFAMNGKSEDATAIDPKTGKVIGTVKLGGGPEFAASDLQGKLFINLEDKNEVVVVDSKKLTATAHWPLAPGKTPTGIAIDSKHHRLFCGCRSQAMIILDSESGHVIGNVPIGAGVDATAFDPTTELAYASNGDGTLSVIHEESPGKFAILQTVKTVKGAKTMALDGLTGHIFLGGVLPASDGKAGGFGVLVVGPKTGE